MVNQISKETREELVGAIRDRYKDSTKKQKVRILDELGALTGFHRKHAIRLIREQGNISHTKEGHCSQCFCIQKAIFSDRIPM